MEAAFFCYTIAMLLIFSATAMIALSSYFVSRKRSYLFVMAFFVFYALDLALIFQYEYFGLNITLTMQDFYGVDSAWIKTALSLGALQSLWMLACDALDERRTAVLYGPAIAFVALQAATLLAIPEGPWRQWAYYTERQAAMMLGLAYMVRRARSGGKVERMLVERYRTVLVATFALLVLVVCEDTLNILVLEPQLNGSSFPLYLSERSFSENLVSLLFAACTFRASARTLKLRFDEPPRTDTPQVEQLVDAGLSTYAARYGLTHREREILRLVLLGKSNQNMATELQLAIGTVKTHVHNILKKTGMDSRQSLIQDFWKS